MGTNSTKGCFPPLTTPVLDAASFARGEFRFTEPWLTYFACLAQNQGSGDTLVDDDGRVRSGGLNCEITTIFEGQEVCLSPGPFSDNPISGAYQQDLYNFLQQFPGAWQFGCISGIIPGVGPGFEWPWVDIDPRPAFPIPPSWAPYMIVTGTVSPYVGSFVIHRSDTCPP